MSKAMLSLALGALFPLMASAEPKTEKKPRVFVPESESWSIGGELGIPDFSEGWDITGGAKPQTAEIVKTIHERCPKVVVTRKEEKADYVLVLQHEGGKVFVRKDNKYAVFNADGDAILSGSTRSLGNAVKEACTAILSDWRDSSSEK